MIWLSRLITAIEVFLLIKAIQKKHQTTHSSTEKDASPDASTSETTEHMSSTNSQPIHQKQPSGQPTD